jgi:tryptophan-rich sensory protein
MNKILKLFLLVLVCEGVGILGSIFTFSAIPTWYAGLNKPFFSPPNFVFGPVWTTLYFLMGISLFLVLEKNLKKEKQKLIFLFSLQLLLNFIWSFIFFGAQNPPLAFVNIIALWFSIAILIYKFWPYSRLASILLMPYLAWVSFASLLNLAIVILN